MASSATGEDVHIFQKLSTSLLLPILKTLIIGTVESVGLSQGQMLSLNEIEQLGGRSTSLPENDALELGKYAHQTMAQNSMAIRRYRDVQHVMLCLQLAESALVYRSIPKIGSPRSITVTVLTRLLERFTLTSPQQYFGKYVSFKNDLNQNCDV